MIQVVYSIDEAEIWFIVNSSGTVICNKDGITEEVDCFTDAVIFFNNK